MLATGTPEDFVRCITPVSDRDLDRAGRAPKQIDQPSETKRPDRLSLIIPTFWRTYLKFDPDVQYNAVLAPCYFFIAGAVRKLPFYPLSIGEAQVLKARAYLLCDVRIAPPTRQR